MFNLERAIAEWRRQMRTAGIKTPATLDELESHLREDIRTLVSAGTAEERAFQRAVWRLGRPESVSGEFKKINPTRSRPVVIGALLWTSMSIALAILLVKSQINLLLGGHIFSLTAGYGAAFLTGGFGIYGACCRWFRAWSAARQQAVSGAIFLFSGLSAGLVAVGIGLGLVWSRQNLGGYWAGGAREIGSLCACAWLLSAWAVQRFGRVSDRIVLLLCLGGDVIVSMAWVGPFVMRMDGCGIEKYWPLAVFLGIHLVFLVMGMVPASKEAEA